MWRVVAAAVSPLALGLLGCALDVGLEGKSCSPDGTCFAGYVCDGTGRCIRPEALHPGAGGVPGAVADSATDAAVANGGRGADTGMLDGATDADARDGSPRTEAGAGGTRGSGGTMRGTGGTGGTTGGTGGAAVCAEERARCEQDCVDLTTSTAHCGSCNAPCPHGSACFDGSCVPPCDTRETSCDGACVDLAEDEEHCGECREKCKGRESCRDGACERD